MELVEDEIEIIKKEVYNCLRKAYSWLFEVGNWKGYWEDVRSTALVLMALSLRVEKDSLWIKKPVEWLLSEQKPYKTFRCPICKKKIENDIEICPDCNKNIVMATWNEEIWDTSLAIISLREVGVSHKDEQLQKSLQYILGMYNVNGRNNWHDEPWETSFALLTLFEFEITEEYSNIIINAGKWLMSLQDEHGRIVSPHYTAYFLIINNNIQRLNIPKEEKENFVISARKASEYLLRNISRDKLWTSEGWSNGQILWSIMRSKMFPSNRTDIYKIIVDWFKNKQEEYGGNKWEDIEDTASSIIGLYYLLRELESLNLPILNSPDIKIKEILKTDKEPIFNDYHKLIEKFPDGYISINISPRLRNILIIIFALLSGLSVFTTLFDFFKGILSE